MKKFAIILFSLFFTAVSVFSTASQAGAIFLMIYPGARAMSMGGAYTAIADDALASYYNPAGLGLQDKKDVILMHVEWLPALQAGMYYEYLGGVLPTEYGNFGASIIYLTTGETYATDDSDPTGRWRTFDFALSISYAYKLRENLSLGSTGKFIYSFLAPDWVVQQYLGNSTGGQGQTIALDIGALYTVNNAVDLGLSISNMGPGIGYLENGQKDPLPLSIRLGASFTVLENELNKLLIATDINKVVAGWDFDSLPDNAFSFSFTDLIDRANGDSSDSLTLSWLEREVLDTWLSLGMEYVYYDLLALRGGYFLDYIGRRKGFTFGAGVIINHMIRIDLGIDSNIYDFDTSNYRISLGMRF